MQGIIKGYGQNYQQNYQDEINIEKDDCKRCFPFIFKKLKNGFTKVNDMIIYWPWNDEKHRAVAEELTYQITEGSTIGSVQHQLMVHRKIEQILIAKDVVFLVNLKIFVARMNGIRLQIIQ